MTRVPSVRTSADAPAAPTDADLVLAARQGEAWAPEALFRRHADALNRFVYRLLGGDQELDDVVQDSFVEALKSLAKLAEPQAFQSWLFSIAVARVRRTLRHRRMLSRLGLRKVERLDDHPLVASTAPADTRAELRSALALMDKLPTDLRIVFSLRRVEGLAVEDIAHLTKLSPRTVKRRAAEAEALFARIAGEPEGAGRKKQAGRRLGGVDDEGA